MKKLRILCSPKGNEGVSTILGEYLSDSIPGEEDLLDLTELNVPYINPNIVKHNEGDLDYNDLNEKDKKIIDLQEDFIKRLKNCDILIMSVPMWNLSYPAVLKAFFDIIIKFQETFTIENGEHFGSLDNIKECYVLTSKRGFFKGTDLEHIDQLEPQVTTLLNFIGITNIKFFDVEGINILGRAELKQNMEMVKQEIREYISIDE